MAVRMSCGQLAVDNPSSAKRRSSCLVSMSLARWMRTQEAAQLPPAGHESSHSELRASPDRKSLFKYEFDDIRVVSDPYKAVPLMLFAHAHAVAAHNAVRRVIVGVFPPAALPWRACSRSCP